MKMTRRQAFAGIGGMTVLQPAVGPELAAAQSQPTHRPSDEKVPVHGKAGPGLEPFDDAMLTIMDRHGVPGAALAIAREGKLVLAKGYGWANVATGEPVKPDTRFGLASLSKSITAVAVLKLVEQKKLDLDNKILERLNHIKPIGGAKVDPRLRQVTVRQCLNHSGGWDRGVHGDAINWEPQICRALRLRPPVSSPQFTSFAMAVPLDFAPGTNIIYSNIGYMLLGEVIAKASGQSYERFVTEQVLKPMGISQTALHKPDGKYLAAESLRYLAGSLIPLPALQLPMVNAAGGWIASAIDMLRFLTNLDGSRGQCVLEDKSRTMMIEAPPQPLKPRANGSFVGLGWDFVMVKGQEFSYFKDGSCQGMRTFMKRLPNGVNWALLYNASMEFDPQDMQTATAMTQDVHKQIESFAKYPDIDLFGEFR